MRKKYSYKKKKENLKKFEKENKINRKQLKKI